MLQEADSELDMLSDLHWIVAKNVKTLSKLAKVYIINLDRMRTMCAFTYKHFDLLFYTDGYYFLKIIANKKDKIIGILAKLPRSILWEGPYIFNLVP